MLGGRTGWTGGTDGRGGRRGPARALAGHCPRPPPPQAALQRQCPNPEPAPPGGHRPVAAEVVSPALSSRPGGPRLPDGKKPPNMASEVSGISRTPVLQASKRGGGAPWAPAGTVTCARDLPEPDLSPSTLLVIVLAGSRQWVRPGAPARALRRALPRLPGIPTTIFSPRSLTPP